MVRNVGALEASAAPHGSARLIAATRDVLRRPGPPVLLWIFPEGRFGHRMAPIVPCGGVLAAVRACPDVPVLICGIDYTVFRGFRPHACLVLRYAASQHLSLVGLTAAIEGARAAAADLSGRWLPLRSAAVLVHPGGWRAGRRSREPWLHVRQEIVEQPVSVGG
jgi:1-acyl-sn-glycerol-3-phosphate acyltransferase